MIFFKYIFALIGRLFDQNERESEKLFLTSSDQLSAIDWESKSEKKFNSDLSVVQEVSVKKEVSPMTFMEKTIRVRFCLFHFLARLLTFNFNLSKYIYVIFLEIHGRLNILLYM